MNPKRHRISPVKTAFARQLRKDMTFPERLLWSRLKSKQLSGLKFRRQHVIEPFIVDFFCPTKRLVVELDGDSHQDEARDAQRTLFLRGLGLTVVRYTNQQIQSDLDWVLVAIARNGGFVGVGGK